MATAFIDMLGLLMIIPLLPFYVKQLGGNGFEVAGMHFGIGMITGIHRVGVHGGAAAERADVGDGSRTGSAGGRRC